MVVRDKEEEEEDLQIYLRLCFSVSREELKVCRSNAHVPGTHSLSPHSHFNNLRAQIYNFM